MLAQANEYINEASETVYHLTQEEQIRQQCEAREDYLSQTIGDTTDNGKTGENDRNSVS